MPAAKPPRCADLMRALERVRSRFVVAMAAESKATPPNRRIQYMETEAQIRLCLSQLRRVGSEARGESTGWIRALEQLTSLMAGDPPSAPAEAENLSGRIRTVLQELEMTRQGWEEPPLALGPGRNRDPLPGSEPDPPFPGCDQMS